MKYIIENSKNREKDFFETGCYFCSRKEDVSKEIGISLVWRGYRFNKKEIKEGLENLTTFRDMVVDMLQDQDTVNSELNKMNRPIKKDGQYDGIEVTKEELINEALVTINITKCNTCKRNMLEKIFEFGAYCAAAGLVNIDIYKSISKKFFT